MKQLSTTWLAAATLPATLLLTSGPAAALQQDPGVRDTSGAALQEALRAHRHPLALEDGELTGPGADLLVREAGEARYTLVGETHGVAEAPELTAALFRALQPHGYRHLAVEIGPVQADRIGEILAGPRPMQAYRRFLRDHWPAVPFYAWESEAELLAAADRVTVVERDSDLAAFLREEFAGEVSSGRLDVVEGDALEVDLDPPRLHLLLLGGEAPHRGRVAHLQRQARQHRLEPGAAREDRRVEPDLDRHRVAAELDRAADGVGGVRDLDGGLPRDPASDRREVGAVEHQRAFDAIRFDSRPAEDIVDGLGVPALIVWGRSDQVLNPAGAQVLAGRMEHAART